MRIMYEEGPERVVMGEAGMFIRGEAKEVEDGLARQILGKGTIKFISQNEIRAATRPAPAKAESQSQDKGGNE